MSIDANAWHEPDAQRWRHITLSPDTEDGIRRFMGDCALNFGRLDFAKTDGELFFLEVNPNGQWAWLDSHDRVGPISAMLKAIRLP